MRRVLFLVCFVSSVAFAQSTQPSSSSASQAVSQPASTSQATSTESLPVISEVLLHPKKSPWKAALLSVVPTVVGTSVGVSAFVYNIFDRETPFEQFALVSSLPLMGGSLIVSSSLGHIYAGDRKHLKWAALVDGVALADIVSMSIAYRVISSSCGPDEGSGAFDFCGGEAGTLIAVTSGIGLVIGVALWNMFDSAFTVQRQRNN
jgi:hypothetical protein